MLEKIKTVKPDTWARTICFALSLINQVLVIFGKEALPFAEDDVYQIISIAALFVTGVAAWWKNNSFTSDAKKADKFLSDLKSGKEN